MVKPNTKFELDVEDICLIEEALVALQNQNIGSRSQQIEDLKAKIYHQKNWYRPDGVYISG